MNNDKILPSNPKLKYTRAMIVVKNKKEVFIKVKIRYKKDLFCWITWLKKKWYRRNIHPYKYEAIIRFLSTLELKIYCTTNSLVNITITKPKAKEIIWKIKLVKFKILKFLIFSLWKNTIEALKSPKLRKFVNTPPKSPKIANAPKSSTLRYLVSIGKLRKEMIEVKTKAIE